MFFDISRWSRCTGLAGLMALAGWNQSLTPVQAEEPAKEIPVKAGELRQVSGADQVAAAVDALLQKAFEEAKVTPAGPASDEDFLRRVSLDLTGTIPSARDVTLFGLDPSPDRRAQAIERMLASDAWAENWARYWRDVLFLRATNMRAGLASQAFLDWMKTNLQQNRHWDEIATDIITATGPVTENGATALFYIQEAEPENVAGEVSRIFLGIQMQCANCHDHPWDGWKREQFHELAAFFPRTALRQQSPGDIRTFELVSVNATPGDPGERLQQLKAGVDRIFAFADRNRDGRLEKSEAGTTPLSRGFDLLLQAGDKNKDGALSKAEIREMPAPPAPMMRRGATEHMMADLNNPAAPGTRIDPKFFINDAAPEPGLSDLERRETLARYLTSTGTEWFSKAFVNRMWTELTGEGFYTPVDDMGPDRKAVHPEVLDLLAAQFTAHDYDIRWLMKAIALTSAYQRQIRPQDPSGETPPFAAASPTRLRGDQVYQSLTTSLGLEPVANAAARGMAGGGPFARRSPREQFSELFGFDPSTPQADVTGTIPQALFLMNGAVIQSQIRATGNTRLAALLRTYPDDMDALAELYLLVLSREPSEQERRIATEHIASVGNRGEAFEDLLWSLINSSEFLSRR